jgi:hypothetical protein
MKIIPSTTKCAKCVSCGFEAYNEHVIGCKLELTFIRCRNCKTAVGVLEPELSSILIRDLAKKQGINLVF